MKALNILILITFFCACTVQKRSVKQNAGDNEINKNYRSLTNYNRDTSAYMIENFVKNQEFYKQKPISVLLNKLEVPVKYFVYGSDTDDGLYSKTISIAAYTFSEIERKKKRKTEPAILVIYWDKPVLVEDITKLVKKNERRWDGEVANIFGKQIIDHIDYVHYKFK